MVKAKPSCRAATSCRHRASLAEAMLATAMRVTSITTTSTTTASTAPTSVMTSALGQHRQYGPAARLPALVSAETANGPPSQRCAGTSGASFLLSKAAPIRPMYLFPGISFRRCPRG